MIKLICTECRAVWYTANSSWSDNCDSCGGLLVEEDMPSGRIKRVSSGSAEKEIASSSE